jgi:hypothetical protein
MVFDYLSGSTSISNIIFSNILKINPSLMYKYTSVTDQALYLILIPSVIILLFVWLFGYWFMGSKNSGLRILISGVAYIYVVYSGWYGSWMVPIILAWFPLILIAYFGFFIMTKILHPVNVRGAANVMNAVFDKATSKSKDIETTEKNIKLLDKKIDQLKNMMGNVKGNDKAEAEIIAKMADLEHAKMDQEDHLRKLGG